MFRRRVKNDKLPDQHTHLVNREHREAEESSTEPPTHEADMLGLQQMVGNQGVRSLLGQGRLNLKPGAIQAKLTVGAPDDAYEHEADAVASQVMRMDDSALEEEPVQAKREISTLQREAMPEEEIQAKRAQRDPLPEEEEPVQAKRAQREAMPEEEIQAKRAQRDPLLEEEEPVQAKRAQREAMPEEEEALQADAVGSQTPAVSDEAESRIESRRGRGQALPDSARAFFEPRFGQDFSGVQIHTGSEADSLNRELEARAFTTGQDIFFRSGEYNPESSAGRELLAHELTHVVQQGGSGEIQRAPLTAAQKAQNLQSPVFAGDPRLEDAFDNSPPIAWGEKGDAVAKIQQALIDDGFEMPISTRKTGSPDGIFGNETRETVKAFQRKHTLTPDGIVGRDTLGKMDQLYSGRGVEPEVEPEIEATDEAIGQHIVENMDRANDQTTKSPTSGIWYAKEYKYMHDQNPDKYPWDESYYQGYADPTYWERIGFVDWRLKPGVSASEGIKAWLKGLTIAECLSTTVAIEIDALRASLGDAKFDEMYGSAEKPMPEESRLRVRAGTAGTPLEGFMVPTDAAKKGDTGTVGKRPVNKGEWYYFYNHPKYLLKHPGGDFQGENAVYMGDNAAGEQIWSGLGISNVTEEGMYEAMVDAYNQDRSVYDYQSIVTYHTIKPIPEKSKNYKELYEKYLDHIDPRYRHDSGEFEDTTSVDKILNDPEYTIGDTTRKGGFLVSVGSKLDADRIKALRGR